MRTGKRVNHLIFCAVFVGTLLWPQLQSTTADTLPFLEPVDVFTRAVDVVQSMPLLNVDSQVTHNLYFRAPGATSWQVVPLPADLGKFSTDTSVLRSDGTYLLGDSYPLALEWQRTSEVWLFDPKTAQIAHPASQCGMVQALAGEGKWVVYQPPGDQSHYFCSTENGKLSAPLPSNVPIAGYCSTDFRENYQPWVSPDASHVIIPICGDTSPILLYAYEPAKNVFTFLGATPSASDDLSLSSPPFL